MFLILSYLLDRFLILYLRASTGAFPSPLAGEEERAGAVPGDIPVPAWVSVALLSITVSCCASTLAAKPFRSSTASAPVRYYVTLTQTQAPDW